jgi:RNA polymerase sigma-70 factor (ECF subfamily)
VITGSSSPQEAAYPAVCEPGFVDLPGLSRTTHQALAEISAEQAAALARLPASHRGALLLLVWAGLGYEQVAAATGVPPGTVQSRISRARRRLREQLADLDPAKANADW